MSLVSIVMPSYNAEKTIAVSINSVISQSYSDWELLVVDDCSTDNTISIVQSFCDKRIKLFVLRENSGSPVIPRNFAIDKASGEYIAFLDSDDIWFADKLSFQLSAMKSSGYLISHSSYNRVDENGVFLNVVSANFNVTYNKLLHGNCIGNLTGIYNCYILGKFYQKKIGHEDYLMWLNIISNNDSLAISTPLASYRVLNNSVSSNKFRAMYWHFNILKREMGINIFKVIYLMFFYIRNALAKRF
ncbi:glycosyltransferase family 2 protein [Shewanella sp. HL-SH8]|uniref:glycosyltransferase family 2 protein n=1 Tax=Shewanella sp. HL-SH8 TaxID=3436242 RepID=UPI003EBDEC1C